MSSGHMQWCSSIVITLIEIYTWHQIPTDVKDSLSTCTVKCRLMLTNLCIELTAPVLAPYIMEVTSNSCKQQYVCTCTCTCAHVVTSCHRARIRWCYLVTTFVVPRIDFIRFHSCTVVHMELEGIHKSLYNTTWQTWQTDILCDIPDRRSTLWHCYRYYWPVDCIDTNPLG